MTRYRSEHQKTAANLQRLSSFHKESGMITTLATNEVFVFGSNAQGFHGAGAAGFACRGDARNNWREDARFTAARTAPEGDARRVGKWAVFGQARGYQEGSEGHSYAVQTIERPGARRSTNRREIYYQLVDLWAFVKQHPELTFFITPLGEGYSGWTREEMKEVWDFLFQKHGTPENIKFVGRDEGVQTT